MTAPVDAPPTFVVRDQDDLLALAPVALGFVPEESVTVLALGRGPHARLDLPRDALEAQRAAAVLAAPVRTHGVDRVAVLVHTDDPAAALVAAHAVVPALEAAGAEVLDALRADDTHWFPLLDARGRPRPFPATDGRAYDLGAHPLTAQAVLAGRLVLARRRDVEERVRRLDAVAAARVQEAYEERGPLTALEPLDLLAELGWLVAFTQRYRSDRVPGGADDRPGDAEVARLLRTLDDARLRDVAWVPLEREDAARAVEVWLDVLGRCAGERAARPAAVLAYAAWRAGDGALAWCAVDRARAADPDDELAGIVAVLLERAVSPEEWDPRPVVGWHHTAEDEEDDDAWGEERPA